MVSYRRIILIVILAIIVIGGVYLFTTYHQAAESFSGEHHVLVLCSDPSEQRPGVGSVDMAFVVTVTDGNLEEVTPVYPGGLAHPTLEPTADMRAEGLDRVYLHDSLWSDDLENGTEIAQEIVEYHTNMSTDIVLVVTPEAIDAMVNAVGPVYSNGELVDNVSSIDFLREDQDNNGATRGDAIEGLADGIIDAANKNDKRNELIESMISQYTRGNIKAVPSDKVAQFVTYEGINSLLG